MPDKELSLGEFMVRVDFNAATDTVVRSQIDHFKMSYAHLINEVEAIPEKEDWSPKQKASFARLKARVYTLLEDASGLTVKAVTV